ncbi:NUDIX hydrolase [Halosimplex amylolyticum]|uniref:NUDIX hydrolase n=1 Tax=Halosimplex amylolyticum TaxID=3396616 RepID=UPI003F560BDB
MTDDLAWETLDSRTSYTCEGFDIVTDTVRFPNGVEAEYDYLAEGESVVVLPFTPGGDLVVIEEWRQAVGRVNRALPAGGVEDDDAAPDECVARELEEETGYRPGGVEHLTTVEPANGFADAVFHYFVARDCEPTGEQDLDYNEDIRVETTTFDALVEAARDDELRDGRSMLAVLYFELFGDES